FYDLNYDARTRGIYHMTSAVAHFAERSFRFVYLGTCYSRNALYKTQFAGAEFFNGFRWSPDIEELKFVLQHDAQAPHRHLLESPEYLEQFYGAQLDHVCSMSRFKIRLR
ncbi:MAG: hypothetical protein N3G20_11825, partial [Verrucomicrobiae bacterium]|nr:hypothetical protein [Verrucomicrobiae bacterium]